MEWTGTALSPRARTRNYNMRGYGRQVGGHAVVHYARPVKNRRRHIPYAPGYARISGAYGRYTGAHAVEKKYHDVVTSDAVVTSTWAVTPTLIQIPQGTTEITRDGRKCSIASIQCHFQCLLPGTVLVANTADTLRIVCYQDRQCNGATATAAQLFKTDEFLTFMNLNNSRRFKILWTKTIDLCCEAGSGDSDRTTSEYGAVVISFKVYKKVHIPIEYDSTAGAITEIRSNNISMAACTSGGFAGYSSNWRFRFTG